MASKTPRLAVRTPFRALSGEKPRDYVVGDIIDAPDEVKFALAEHAGAVIRLEPEIPSTAEKA